MNRVRASHFMGVLLTIGISRMLPAECPKEQIWLPKVPFTLSGLDASPDHQTLVVQARTFQNTTQSAGIPSGTADPSQTETSPEYWAKRARFLAKSYRTEEAEAAFKKGLELAPPAPPMDEWRGKHQIDVRSDLLGEYVRFLKSQKRDWDAFCLLRKEIATMPMRSESTLDAAKGLAWEGFKDTIWADDPVLWRWLENRPVWTELEKQLLVCMLRQARDRDAFLDTAEKLAKHNDASRSLIVAKTEVGAGLIKRGIPLLQALRDRGPYSILHEAATCALLEACLKSGDRPLIQSVFPERLHLSADRLQTCLTYGDWWVINYLFPDILNQPSYWSQKLALIAAKGGAKSDAFLIWSHCAKADPSNLDALPGLVKSGLRDELIAFYTDLQKEMPSSAIPAKALDRLKALKP